MGSQEEIKIENDFILFVFKMMKMKHFELKNQ